MYNNHLVAWTNSVCICKSSWNIFLCNFQFSKNIASLATILCSRFACNLGNVVQEAFLGTKYNYGLFGSGLLGKKRSPDLKKRNLDSVFNCSNLRCYFLPILRDIFVTINSLNNSTRATAAATNASTPTTAAGTETTATGQETPRRASNPWWRFIWSSLGQCL